MHIITNWFKERFSDPQVVILVMMLLMGILAVLFLGNMLAPVIWALVIAYLLEGAVRFLELRKMPRKLAVVLVFCLFMLLLLAGLFIMVPLLTRQIGQLLNQIPAMIAAGQDTLLHLPERYPKIISEFQVREMMAVLRSELMGMGQNLLSLSLASLMNVIAFMVYMILVPLLIFFFLKDKEEIIRWVRRLLPRHLGLATEVWTDVNQQIGNYIRGKVWEILIVWSVSSVTFAMLKLQFAMLIGLMVGISVLIPYIGASVVTFPVALIAYFQWGWSSELLWVVVAYLIIQALDGNVLAPVLLSEVVNLHPIAVIVAILVFGGLWGFWGVFFAIPLATLVHAVIKSLPGRHPTIAPPTG